MSTRRSLQQPSAPNTRLRGPWLRVAQLCFLVVAAANLGFFVAALPIEYQTHLYAGYDKYEPGLWRLGISVPFYAAFLTVLDIIQVAVFVGTGVVLFWRKRDDWMVMLVALASMTFGTMFTAALVDLATAQPHLWPYVAVLRGFGLGASLIVPFYLFPDGQFVPRWSSWLTAFWGSLTVVWIIFPDSPLNLVYVATWVQNLTLSFLVFFAWYSSGVAAQIYRYRRISGPVERQQTKWVVFGTTSGVLAFVLYHLPLLIWPELDALGIPRLLYTFIALPIYRAMILLAPLCIAISALRFRLWDVDLLIKRSLSYAVLSGMLAVLYVFIVVSFQALLRSLTGQTTQIVIAGSTLATAALFSPLRGRVQTFIDRRFYRQRYDTARTLANFGERLRDEPDIERLTQEMILVVHNTMQPEHVSVWLKPAVGPDDEGNRPGGRKVS